MLLFVKELQIGERERVGRFWHSRAIHRAAALTKYQQTRTSVHYCLGCLYFSFIYSFETVFCSVSYNARRICDLLKEIEVLYDEIKHFTSVTVSTLETALYR